MTQVLDGYVSRVFRDGVLMQRYYVCMSMKMNSASEQ